MTNLKTRDGNDYGMLEDLGPGLRDPKNPINKGLREAGKTVNKNLREGIRDILEVIHHAQTALEKGLKEEDCLPLLFPAPCTVQKTFKKGVKVIGKELEKGLKEAEKAFKVIGKELETKLKEAKKGFEVIGQELEKQIKKVGCFPGTSTVQTRRGVKKYIQHPKHKTRPNWANKVCDLEMGEGDREW